MVKQSIGYIFGRRSTTVQPARHPAEYRPEVGSIAQDPKEPSELWYIKLPTSRNLPDYVESAPTESHRFNFKFQCPSLNQHYDDY